MISTTPLYSQSYNGPFEQQKLLSLIRELEQHFKHLEVSRKWKKRVIMCLTEAFQNVNKYSKSKTLGKLQLVIEKGHCKLLVSNAIEKEERPTMQKALENIVSLSSKELEQEYSNMLTESLQSGKSGLGWYCLSLYSSEPLQFYFEESTTNECTFYLNINVHVEDDIKNMKALHIEATEELPEVHLDKVENRFEIKGRSIPNDAFTFYQPVKQWVNKYIVHANSITELHCELEYFNSASQKNLLDIFKAFNLVSKDDKSFKLIWYYQEGDEELKQIGVIFQQLLHLDMQFVELED